MQHQTYDYEAQKWVTGEDAKRLLLAQLRETRALIAGPRGAEFLTFSGDRRTAAEALAEIDAQLAKVEAIR